MNDVLKELYLRHYLDAHRPSPEYRAACKEETALWETLLSGLSEEEQEELQARESDVLIAANYEWFLEGIRLGASLMLELL